MTPEFLSQPKTNWKVICPATFHYKGGPLQIPLDEKLSLFGL